MLASVRSQLTFANVVSLIALFIALSGGAYALTLPNSSVGAAQIKKNAVRASEIRKGAVRSSEVKNRSLLSKDFKPGQLPAGPPGPPGPPGSDLRGDSERILYGRAGAGTDQTLLLAWPAMGLEVRTGDTDVPDSPAAVRIANTNPPSGPDFYVTMASTTTPLSPGAAAAFGGLDGVDARVVENGRSGRLVRLDCFANVIAAGDDGFMQCMALTAGPE